jgi:pyrroloquinoline quinone biosynthesis protein D
MKAIQPSTRLQRNEGILTQEAAGTIVLLSLEIGQYYCLDGVGGRAWELCDGHRTVSEIAGLLSEEFDAPAATIERDLMELLTNLADENLLGEPTPKTGRT